MKRGSYGLNGKQLSFGFLALVCTIVLIWAWDKTPRIAFLLSPQNRSLEPFPVAEISSGIGKDVSHVKTTKNEKTFDASVKKETPNSSTAEQKESLGRVTTKVDSIHVSDGNNSSKLITATDLATSQSLNSGDSSERVVKNLSTNMSSGGCNYAKGKWVEDEARPLYSGFGCKQWLSPMWACRLTQRTDFSYEKLRWQPKDCAMDEFTGPKFLERWVMHVGGKPNVDKNIDDINGAKNFTIHSILDWANLQILKYSKLKVFYRSISPRHFFNGDWNTGGTCDNTVISGKKEVLQDESSDSIAASAVKGKKVKFLDITANSKLRDDGHMSKYSLRATTPAMQDCLHWCLPGVPDTWNEILFTQI